jgi:hypothetical protein
MRSAAWLAGATVLGSCIATTEPARTSTPASAGVAAPAYTAAGHLVRPADYREWTFVTSGLGMTYGPAPHANGQAPLFDNVFVTRDAYLAFLDGGTWPDGTMFVLEIRRAESGISIDGGGRTQGDVVAIEASVKDSSRFPAKGWAYFTFDGQRGFLDDAAPLPSSAACYSCHERHAAVDNTFVQFYPTLREAARRHGKLPHPGGGVDP